MIWIEILGTLATFLAALVATLTWFERRIKTWEKQREERQANKEKDEIKRIEKIVIAAVDSLQRQFEIDLNKTLNNFVKKQDLENLDKKLKRQNKMISEFERNRIRGELLNFAEDLKNGIQKSSVAYQHAFSIYEKYKRLGGNSYIDSAFEYIRLKQKQEETANRNKDPETW